MKKKRKRERVESQRRQGKNRRMNTRKNSTKETELKKVKIEQKLDGGDRRIFPMLQKVQTSIQLQA
jgi:hypothetical protein